MVRYGSTGLSTRACELSLAFGVEDLRRHMLRKKSFTRNK